mmetsp:Transcript_8249/g.7656  ORF Transcript_8249/g.7656 Transcript_8249/m.7656 type:complete len:182 (+) Transcript_8249:432-977(+)
MLLPKDLETQQLSTPVKCNKYVNQTLIASSSHARGGYVGIISDAKGFVLEGTIATVAVLLKNGDFVFPPFTKIVMGTTALKIGEFIEKEVLPNYASKYESILGAGHVKQVVRREITVEEAIAHSKEVFFLGGDVLVPILEWDGHRICNYKGPLATLLQKFLVEEYTSTSQNQQTTKIEFVS